MASVVALDTSPLNLLRSMQGAIVAAQLAYPQVLHLEIRASDGDIWRLSTQGAKWSPTDPSSLVGQSLEDVRIDDLSGGLRCQLSAGSVLEVSPLPVEAVDDPPSWEVISPDGLVLEFGPGLRWQISSADAPASSRS